MDKRIGAEEFMALVNSGKLEDGASAGADDAVQLSLAISQKRIADGVEKMAKALEDQRQIMIDAAKLAWAAFRMSIHYPEALRRREPERIMVTGGAFISVFVDDKTLERLEWYARERDTYHGRTAEDLAEAAISEAALKADTR
jgi:hypothetical protein